MPHQIANKRLSRTHGPSQGAAAQSCDVVLPAREDRDDDDQGQGDLQGRGALITQARRGDLHSRRLVAAYLLDPRVDEEAVRADRAGAQGSHRRLHPHHQVARAPRRRRRTVVPGVSEVAWMRVAARICTFGCAARPSRPCCEHMSTTSRIAEDPLSLQSVMRSFIADAITPISAFLALAQPGRSCLLESVEGTDRISRYSFIGIDYLEATRLRRRSGDARGNPRADRQVSARYVGAAVSGRRGVRLHLRRGAAVRTDRPEAAVRHAVFRCAGRGARDVGRVRSLHASGDVDRLRARRATSRARRRSAAGRVRTHAARPRASRVPAEIRVRGDRSRSRWIARPSSSASRRPSSISTKATSTRCRSGSGFRPRSRAGRRSISTARSAPAIRRRTCSTSSTAGRRCSARRPSFWCGSTGGRARMRPLAGTRSRGEDPAAGRGDRGRAAGQRERARRARHAGRSGPQRSWGRRDDRQSVHVDELMMIERFSHVMHIVSNVVAELRPDRDALDLFAATFPAGTVTGAPKIRAMQLIDELEPVARGFYAGQRRAHRLRRRHGFVHHPALRRGRRRESLLAGFGRDRRRQRSGRRIPRDLAKTGDRPRRVGIRPA